jgi:sec-independent protein translocase protein TatC
VEDRDAELAEHLQELRTRLIRSVVYLAAGFAVGWVLYWHIYYFLTAPIVYAIKLTGADVKMMITSVTQPFILRCQVSFVAGTMIAAPAVTFEVWGFVAPALTSEERRPLKWIAPLCALLFAAGVTIGYEIIPAAMRYFMSFVPTQNTELRPSVSENLVFIIKMLLAFGVVFELPIVLIFLGKLGIVNSRMLRQGWRHAMVGVSVLAAVATPSNDAITMLAMAIPLAGLYFVSIVLVKIVEPKKPKSS